ncbi:hypothetical protein HS1genome_1709 [Sulfodiicoccus acidiphilus]|uniref:Uncharacterized protein n=1 Tax=Sulfodiicoccus acidiphilus TaxID=1670455 RepID=A0A348B568_9CREN|nr:hypothetical protein HS1genome_1709 [Sulfodiicoccus acidiphilus]GGT89130.1 hypothetical protein GCM10007116_03700 [Sulfodiicoccus acidiphilus]
MAMIGGVLFYVDVVLNAPHTVQVHTSTVPPPTSGNGQPSSVSVDSLVHSTYFLTPEASLSEVDGLLAVQSSASVQGVVFPVRPSGNELTVTLVAYVDNSTLPIAYNPGISLLTGDVSAYNTLDPQGSVWITMWGQGGGANARVFVNGNSNPLVQEWSAGGGEFTFQFVNDNGYVELAQVVVNGAAYSPHLDTGIPWASVDGVGIVADNGVLLVQSLVVNGQVLVS